MKNNFTKYYSIAPMMGKTDSYFCYLMSFINKDIRIYTEMMHTEAIIRTNILENYKILKDLSNITVQIAGNQPNSMAKAAKKIAEYGFSEININCGCPSKNVIAGEFGLSLLQTPKIVKKCVEAIRNETSISISVKTRIGIGHIENVELLDNFVNEVNSSGVNKYVIHARNGILGNYSTKNNLSIPPLKYKRVFELKKKFFDNKIIINGGFLNTLDFSKYKNKVDGIMIGREAYKNPWIFVEKNISYKQKINVILRYLYDLKIFFKNAYFNKNSIMHIQKLFNNINGAKEWRKNVNYTLHNNDLQHLLNYIESK